MMKISMYAKHCKTFALATAIAFGAALAHAPVNAEQSTPPTQPLAVPDAGATLSVNQRAIPLSAAFMARATCQS
jgi:hypothetical protein